MDCRPVVVCDEPAGAAGRHGSRRACRDDGVAAERRDGVAGDRDGGGDRGVDLVATTDGLPACRGLRRPSRSRVGHGSRRAAARDDGVAAERRDGVAGDRHRGGDRGVDLVPTGDGLPTRRGLGRPGRGRVGDGCRGVAGGHLRVAAGDRDGVAGDRHRGGDRGVDLVPTGDGLPPRRGLGRGPGTGRRAGRRRDGRHFGVAAQCRDGVAGDGHRGGDGCRDLVATEEALGTVGGVSGGLGGEHHAACPDEEGCLQPSAHECMHGLSFSQLVDGWP